MVREVVAKVAEAVGSPVLITILIVFAANVGALIYLANRQSERYQELYIQLVEQCVPNNRD